MRTNVLASLVVCSLAVAGCSGEDAPSPATDTGADTYVVEDTSPDTSVEETPVDSSTDALDAETGPACGNGILEGTEACDDGNTTDGDGCSSTCENETVGPEDVCPGTTIALTGTGSAPRKGSITGDTSSTKATYEHTCGGGSARDAVYTFTSDVTGRATVTLDATFSALLAANTSCGDKTTEITCDSLTTSTGKITKSFAVTAGAPVYVHVDGAGGASGSFALGVEISTAFCGNGIAELPEQCDDGNATAGDGCGATCALEASGDGSVCPGIAYTFKGNTSVSFAGDTSTLTGTSTSTGQCSSASAKNAIYAITPDKNGSLDLEMRAAFPNAMLHVRRECFSSSYEVDCTPGPASTSKPIPPGTPVKLQIQAFAGEAIFVFADARNSADVGTFVLDAKLSAAVCGNGVLDGGETCDDGNTTSGDGCDSTCKVETVTGDNCTNAQELTPVAGTGGTYSVKRTGSTVGLTDDVNRCGGTGIRQPDAVYTVTAPVDGWMDVTLNRNAYLNLEIATACNLGTSTTGRVTCQTAADGRLPEKYGMAVRAGTQYWLFVDAGVNNASGVGSYLLDVQFRPQTCGNDVIEGTEACDDGNTNNGDGCTSTCTLEPTPTEGNTCATAATFALAETSTGSGVWAGTVTSGTTNLTSNHSSAPPCGATNGKDAWYKIVAPRAGVLIAKVGDTLWDVSLNARPGSCTTTTGTSTNFITCSNVTPRGNEQIAFAVEEGSTYYVIVDGSTKSGAFTLDISVGPSACGDGVVSSGEACDDGNTSNGDGCSSTCAFETLTGVDTCPGFAVALTGTGTAIRSKTITLSTASLSADYTGSCAGSARDGVVAITPDVSGELRVQMSSNYLNVLYARSTCTDSTTQLSCEAPSTTTPKIEVREIAMSVSAGVPVYFFVDGMTGESGTSQLKITLTP